MKSDHAISETVSVILIIFMVLILAIVVAGLLFGANIFQQKSALIVSDIKNQTFNSKNVISVFHRAGDEVYINSSLTGIQEMGIYVDNRSYSWRAQPVLGLNTVKPGTTLFIYYNASKNIYRITSNAATLSTNEAQSVVDCPLKVRLVDERARLLITSWNWTCTPLPPTGPAPTVTSITNTTGYRGWPVIESIVGTNFLTGATAKLNRTGIPDIPATACTYASSTRINCTFDLRDKAASPPNYNVVVTNPDGKQGMRANYFVLSSPAPTITSSTPSTGAQAATIMITSLFGTNFQPGAKVDYTLGNTIINLTNVNVLSRTQISGTLVIPSNASAGSYGVNITNTDNGKGYRAARFTVTSNAPTISSSTPATGVQGTTVVITRLLGTNFQPGAVVVYSNGTTSMPLTSTTVVSSTNITGTLVIPADAMPGPYNVTVTNADLKSISRAATFTVTSNAPTVTARSNATIYTGWMGYELITGTRFVTGAQSVLNTTTGNSIPSTSCDVRSSTQMFCSYDLLGTPVSTAYRVTVINPDGKSGLMTNNLVSVSSPAPTITSSTPSTGAQAATVVITRLLGTYFQPGATVVYSLGGTTIPLQNINVVSPTNITGTLSIPSDATVGSYNVTVTNADLKSISRAATFTVTSNAPTVTARSNATIYLGWMGYELITGTRFVTGAQSVLNTTTGNSIPSTSCDVRSSTQMFCSYNLLGVPVSTGYRVTVINPDGKSGLMTSNLVSVSSPAPAIPSAPAFSPSTGARGTNGVVVTAPGTYLQPNMAIVLTSAGAPTTTITAYSVNVVSPTQVIFTFDIPAGATLGSYTARYTNTDGKTVTRTTRFTVT